MANTSFEPSTAFSDLFFLALDHGFRSIEDGNGPLIPFAVVVGVDGKRSLHRFAANTLEERILRAREHVARRLSELQMYAIAWDGFVTMEGKKTDSILVEALDRKGNIRAQFFQRYAPGEPGKRKAERIGNPGLLSKPESLTSECS